MATFSVSNTFVAGTTAVASQVNTNFSDLITSLSNLNSGADTWGAVKVSGSTSNLVDFTSSSSSGTEISINNTATDGDPRLTFKLSGITKYTIGVDDSDSDTLKFGSTSITTDVWLQMDTSGCKMYLTPGTSLAPALSFSIDTNTGIYLADVDTIAITSGGDLRMSISQSTIIYDAVYVTGTTTRTRIAINNDALAGNSVLEYSLFGSILYTLGVDNSDSDILKFSTTSLVTNTACQIPTTGAQVQFNAGSAATPSISFIGDTNSGLYSVAADVVGIVAGGSIAAKFDLSVTAGQTRFFIYDVDNATLERVTVGAADSGGAGFKVLRIPN